MSRSYDQVQQATTETFDSQEMPKHIQIQSNNSAFLNISSSQNDFERFGSSINISDSQLNQRIQEVIDELSEIYPEFPKALNNLTSQQQDILSPQLYFSQLNFLRFKFRQLEDERNDQEQEAISNIEEIQKLKNDAKDKIHELETVNTYL